MIAPKPQQVADHCQAPDWQEPQQESLNLSCKMGTVDLLPAVQGLCLPEAGLCAGDLVGYAWGSEVGVLYQTGKNQNWVSHYEVQALICFQLVPL